jgi:hypothetical protein
MHPDHRTRPAQWSFRIGVALSLASIACQKQPTREVNATVSPAESVRREPLVAESCEDAKRYPRSVPTNDVRFVNCGETARGTGEAYELGEPIHTEQLGPPPTAAGHYSAGHCDHRGGAIMEYSVFYEAEQYAAAIDCSRARCNAKDARGCNDLGALHWYDLLPGVRKDEGKAVAAFDAGCKLGFARSCLWLAAIHEQSPDHAGQATATYRAACEASPPSIEACALLGERLTTRGNAAEAKPYLQRACRGVTPTASSFGAQRQGCALLADAAAMRGDLVSQREYLRLECAYGTAAPAACAQLGQLLYASGDTRRAAAYLRRACESVTQAKTMFEAACQTLARIDEGGKKP